MKQEVTPLNMYSDEVGGAAKPQTPEEALERFNELLNARDDGFLRGEVYPNQSFAKDDNKENE